MLRTVAWDTVARWSTELGGVCRFRVLEKQVVVITDPKAIKRVFQTAYQVT
jgi:hypothetical protein